MVLVPPIVADGAYHVEVRTKLLDSGAYFCVWQQGGGNLWARFSCSFIQHLSGFCLQVLWRVITSLRLAVPQLPAGDRCSGPLVGGYIL